MKRRTFLQTGALAGGAAIVRPRFEDESSTEPEASAPPKPFELEEMTVTQMQDGMKSGKFTAVSLAKKYLQRIQEIDRQGPTLHSIIEINPDALAIATALDRERKEKGSSRGPLHGIPVLIKDNIDTADRMMTTAG
ncbi:MAG TPA: amidase family protein, partial [Pyrinomonadaceae bacterium]|nr:amidase family protein [Pyrinomonadaceae bacterium]